MNAVRHHKLKVAELVLGGLPVDSQELLATVEFLKACGTIPVETFFDLPRIGSTAHSDANGDRIPHK